MTTRPGRQPLAHRLRHNKIERSPHRLLVIDSESKVCPDAWSDVEGYDLLGADRFAQPGLSTPAELQTLRCWAARLTYRHGREKTGPRQLDFSGTTAEQLADLIHRLGRRDDTLWVFAHNLSYDLALTGVLLRLLRLSWELGRHNLASDAPWAFLRRGRRGLRFADSWSWLPAPVQELGEMLGLEKSALPDEAAALSLWQERCARDVEIETAALERLLDEWDGRQLGSWSLTGPASAWNTMLHRAPGQAVIIDPDPQARSFERRALYSGRRDLTRVGTFEHGPYVLLDLREAYAAVCASQLLPIWRAPLEDFSAVKLASLAGSLEAMMAEATVETATPRYPVRRGATILHPVGRFQTVLAGPELKAAFDRGDLLEVGRGYRYRLGVRMQPWAQWLLSLLRDESGRVDPMLQVFLKQASRTVPGRWGMMIQREGESTGSWRDGWYLEPAVFGEQFTRGAWLHLAGTATQLIRDQDGDDAFPAVLAFVQAWVRLALTDLLDRLGDDRWCQCNTDGAWVPERAAGDLLAYNRQWAPMAVRVKATAQSLQVKSPQHWQADRERAFAGVPRSATEIRPDVFEFQTWPKLAGQMRRGDPRGYVRELRTVDLSTVPVTRWVAEDGCTRPPELTWDAERGNVALDPPAAGCEAHGAPWRQQQHRALLARA